MTISEILAKVLKNIDAKALDGLGDEDKALLQKFNFDAEINSAAANARRKAEAEKGDLEKQIESLKAQAEELTKKANDAAASKMTDMQKLEQRLQTLSKEFERMSAEKAEADRKAAALAREQAIGQLQAKSGISFIDGIDPAITAGAFSKVFDGLDDLTNKVEVDARIAAFRNANKGLIRDTSGFGAGGKGEPAGGKDAVNPWSKGQINLTKQAEIEISNPQEAARLKASAEV